MSRLELPRKMPVRPPEIKVLTKPMLNSIAGVNRILPRQSVVSQLKTLTADGTAISNVAITNTLPRNGFSPVTNIWWAQTVNDSVRIANIETTMAVYPKIGFLAFTDMISDTMPQPGKTTKYSYGTP